MDVSYHGVRHAMGAGSDRCGSVAALIWSLLFRVPRTSDRPLLQEPQGLQVADLALDLSGQRALGGVARPLRLKVGQLRAQ